MASLRPLRAGSMLARAARAQPAMIARPFHTSPSRLVVHSINSKEEFDEALKKPAVLVDCLAECLSNDAKNQGVHFVQFDVDQLPDLTSELGIRAMPTFLIFKDGKKVDELIGANPPKLAELLAKYRP